MTTAYHNLASGDFSQNWSNANQITTNDDWSGVPSVTGFLAEATSASSFDPATFTTDAGVTLDVVANQAATANNGGVVEVDQGTANPAVGFQGSNAADVAGLIFYVDASNRQNVTFAANLRDLDSSADASVQKVVLQYRIGNSGAWTNLASVADASGSGASLVTPISAVLPPAANGQSQVQIRILTGNASGNDELIGVDDIVISSTGQNQPGAFSVGDTSVTEGDAGTIDLTFTVTRDNGSTGAVSVAYATADGTATAGSDYAATSGTLNFADGETSKTVTVTVNADTVAEAHETVFLNLSGATGGATIADAQATGTILDDDGVQPGAFTIGDVSVAEGNAGTTNLVFTVTRTGGSDGAATVDFATANGTASAGSDYAAQSGTLTFADGETSKTITVAVTGDANVEPNETLVVNLTNATGGATIADAQATGTITNDDVAGLTQIHDIQGPAFFSPILAAEGITAYNVASTATVTVRAVVTAIDSFLGSGVQGFYISEELADWDGNANTSEGIFVRTSGAVSGLTVGETVTLTANVMEFQDFTNLPRTMLVNPTNIIQTNDSVALPTFVIDGTAGHKIPTDIISDDNPVFTDATGASGTFDPQNDALDFYETLEGMRVTLKDAVVADGFVGGSNDDFVFFNAYSRPNADQSLLNDRGGYTTTGDPQHYPVDTPSTTDDVKFGGATVHDGSTHGDILEVDFGNVGRGGASSFDQHLTMGDSLGDVTGIIDFDFGVTKLYVTDALDPTKVAALDDTTPVQEVTTLTGDDARSLRIATFNVENLSPVGTAFDDRNGVELTTEEKFDKLAANIATNLDSPDIIVIEEMLDNNGIGKTGNGEADQTWAKLVAEVNAATGKVYQWVDEAPAYSGGNGDVGGAPGGNQRVGFLYDTARVQLGNLAANATLAERRAYTDVVGDGIRTAGDLISVDDTGLGINPADWSGTRRSIVGEFNFNGQTIHVFGSHLPSKGGSDDPYEIGQNGAAGQPANGDWALRNQLGQDLWSAQNKASVAGSLVVSAGDFNEFWYNRPLEVLTGYANPDGSANTTGTKYSNLMVDKLAAVDRFSYDFDGRSQALDTILSDQQLASVASYDVVHINTGYNDRTGAVNPASSDHDPSLASFNLRSFSEDLKGTAGADVIQGFGGNDTIDGLGGTDTAVFSGDRWTYAVSQNGNQVVLTGADGTDTITNVEQFQFADGTYTLAQLTNQGPVFTSPSAFSVAENQTAAAQLAATDPDGDDLVYSITGGADAGLFDIDAATGAVTFKNAPNFEVPADAGGNNVYDVDVAVDDGNGLVGEASLAITVTDVVETPPNYTLQLLHLSDGEAGLLAGDTAKYLAAMADAFEDDYTNSITLSGGDTYLPGPFLAAGTDPSLIPVINATTGSTIPTTAGTTPAPGVVDTAIHNIIGVQASGIGNHEWDLGSNVYSATIAPGGGWVGANYVSVSANLVLSPAGQPADPLASRYTQTVGVNGLEEASSLKGRIAPSAVITEGGEKIGLVGATTQILESISSPSGAEILGFPYGPGPNGEINDMALLAAQLQPVIDDLRAQGVNKIILMSHLQQIEYEKALAPLLRGVDVILAAGSNTRLGDVDDQAVAFPGHEADFADTYPLVLNDADGKTTLIVNTDNEYTYLGRLVVDFDANGDIVLDSLAANQATNGAYASTAENTAEAWGVTTDQLETTAFAEGTKGDKVRDLTAAVDSVIEVKDGNIFGYSNVYLEGERVQVRNQETNLGNVSADANAHVAREALGVGDEAVVVSIKNGGGIRAQIGTIVNNPDGTVTKVPPEVGGEVSQLDVENALRFDNKLMVFDTTAQGLLNILNSPNALAPNNGGFIQIGGVQFSYDPTKPAGQRVRDIALVDGDGNKVAAVANDGVVVAGAPALIQVVALNFTANGGDGYLIKQNADNFRYLQVDGTLSAAVPENLDFTATATIDTYAGSSANLLGEQQAFADYFQEKFGTPDQAFNEADTGQALDLRIQNQTARADTVLVGETLTGTAKANVLDGGVFNDTLSGLAGRDTLNGGGGDDVLDGGKDRDALNGGAGNDTYHVDNAFDVVTELANEGTDTVISTIQLTLGANIENGTITGSNNIRLSGNALDNILNGNAGNNKLEGFAGNDTINGGAGGDTILGGLGKDTLTGGSGADKFTFQTLADAGFGVARDIITDFEHGIDRIVLNTIDANEIKGGNQAFVFIGGTAFGNVAGQLRSYLDGGNTIVAGDTNGDGLADFEIQLTGTPVLASADFLL